MYINNPPIKGMVSKLFTNASMSDHQIGDIFVSYRCIQNTILEALDQKIKMRDMYLGSIIFKDIELYNEYFTDCVFSFSCFYNIKLINCTFDNCKFEDTYWSDAKVINSTFINPTGRMNIRDSIFENCNLNYGWKFSNIRHSNCEWNGCCVTSVPKGWKKDSNGKLFKLVGSLPAAKIM